MASMMTVVYVVGFLLFGCMNTLTTKIQFGVMSEGIDGELEAFHKPWFAVWAMFIGMAVNLLFHFISVSLSGASNLEADKQSSQQLTPTKKFLWVGVPAMFDLTTTGLSSIGLLYISASIWQMLRGANIIFSAVFSVAFLGRKMRAYNWLGVVIVVLGISIVGLSNALMSSSSSVVTASSSDTLFGMAMVLLAQFFSGGQVVAEEKLLKGLNVPRLQLVGYEGIWGIFVMLPVFMVMYCIPGADGGSYENLYDTYLKLQYSAELRKAVALYVVSCMSYNLCAVCVTGALSAVHRTMFMALRTLIVWVVDLSVHYYVDPSISWGEQWSPYSYMELVGFVVLVAGQAIYAGIIQLPGMRYAPSPVNSPPSAVNFQSPAAMKMNSPGLPAIAEEDMDMAGGFIKMVEDES